VANRGPPTTLFRGGVGDPGAGTVSANAGHVFVNDEADEFWVNLGLRGEGHPRTIGHLHRFKVHHSSLLVLAGRDTPRNEASSRSYRFILPVVKFSVYII
jgi:hypothetical protein